MILHLLPITLSFRAHAATPHALDSQVHGPAHWERVAENAITLGVEDTNAADLWAALHFGLIHDAFREDDWADPDHGRRAAAWVRANKADFPRIYDQLVYALEGHADGEVTSRPTAGLCWDADRLDLPRVGVTPDPRMMSTAAGKRAAERLAR